MNFKTTYVLFGILGVVVVVFFLVLFLGGSGKPESDYLFPSANGKAATLTADQVEHVEIERSRPQPEKIVFDRGADKKWQLTQPPGLKADSLVVDSLVGQVLQAHRGPQEKPDEDKSLKKRELDNPAAVIHLRAGSDTYTLNLGAELPGSTTAIVYVNSSEHKDPVPVSKVTIDGLYKNLNDYRSRILLADLPGDISAVKIQEGTGKPVALEKKGEARWVFVEPNYGEADLGGGSPAFNPGGPPPNQNPGVRGLLNALTGLKVESPADFVADNASDKDLADKKLEPASAVLTVEIKRTPRGDKDPQTVTLLVGKPVDDKNQQVFARLKDDRNIVKVPASGLEVLRGAVERPAGLRDKRLVRSDFIQPDAIDITSDKGTYRLRDLRPPEGWTLYRGTAPGKGEATDRNAVQMLVTELDHARVDDFIDADIKIDKPALVVSFWIAGFKTAPKKEPGKQDLTEPELKEPTKPTVELAFAKPDGERVTVRRTVRDGSSEQVSIVKVPLVVFDTMNKPALDFLKREITPFTTEMDIGKNVARLLLVHNGETYELVKETKDNVSSWKFEQPSDLKGQPANLSVIETILRRLNGLRVFRLAAEKPSDDELDKKFGLKSPRSKVSVFVTKDGKTEPVDYVFGNETEDKVGVFLRVGNGEYVYAVGKDMFDILGTELQDTHIFKYAGAKISGIKFVGWKRQNVTPYTLEVEQQTPGNWVVKAPAGFPLNPNQVNGFVDRALANLTALRFLRKGGPAVTDKMFNVNEAENALEIEIRVQGEAEPHKLTIGGLSGTEGFFAKLEPPGRIFVLPRQPWEEMMAAQKYFAKQ